MLPVAHVDPQRSGAAIANPPAFSGTPSATSAFTRVVPRNVPATAASTSPATGIGLLDSLRLRCMQQGAPATIDECLRIAPKQRSDMHRAVLLQRLTLALSDDRRIDSPAGPVNLRADACDTYRLAAPSLPPRYADYQTALTRLHQAILACKVVLPGSYGFLQQSIACESVLRTAVNADQVRCALSGWLNWQWAALAAYPADPQLHALAGQDPLRPTYLAYALDEDSALCADVRLALLSEPRPPSPARDPVPGSTAQRDQ